MSAPGQIPFREVTIDFFFSFKQKSSEKEGKFIFYLKYLKIENDSF